MKEITRGNIAEIKAELQNKIVMLYGAGNAGPQILQLLNNFDIHVDFFVDDDAAKHGKSIEGIKILSYPELKIKSELGNVAVILSSVLSGSIMKKLEPLSVSCYELYNMYVSECTTAIDSILSMKQDKSRWFQKWHRVNELLRDEESKKIWEVIQYVADTRDAAQKRFAQVCSNEEHYFVHPIPALLSANSVLVDCGAYTGDMLAQLKNNNIPFGKIYEIEANPFHKNKIAETAASLQFENKVVIVNCGLCDKNGEMNFFVNYGNSANSRLSETESNLNRGGQNVTIPTRTLDSLIAEKIDFLKTDIEGAEIPALVGAKNLLVTSRPILAISIYHSLDDMVDIPIFLADLLPRYKFFLRHHSFMIGETVLYGIPAEKEEHSD